MAAEAKRSVTAVLISADRNLARVVQQCSSARKIHTDIFLDCGAAMRHLTRTKVEAVLIDWSDARGAATTLNAIRAAASNHNAVVFALTSDAAESQTARSLGASFVVEGPVTAEKLDVYLRAAYGLMLHELRRYFRFPVALPVVLHRSDLDTCYGQTVNLSTGGMAVALNTPLASGESVVVEVQLPGLGEPLKCSAEVAWVDAHGRIGLQFVHAPAALMIEFQQWLAAQLEQYCEMGATTPPSAIV